MWHGIKVGRNSHEGDMSRVSNLIYYKQIGVVVSLCEFSTKYNLIFLNPYMHVHPLSSFAYIYSWKMFIQREAIDVIDDMMW